MISIKSIKSNIKKSINLKIILVTTLCLVVFLAAILGVIYQGMNSLKEETVEIAEVELDNLINEYYKNYIDIVDDYIESQVDNTFEEIHVLSNILQTFFSNRSMMDDVVKELESSEYFRDKLIQDDTFYQNTDDEPSSVFVASYMIDNNGKIDDEAMALIKDTQILDLVLPAFTKYGVKKASVYFQGGENREVFRLAPWQDLGETVKVYPGIFDTPIWEAFNPGLADEWRTKIRQMEDLSEIDDMLRVTPPVQDGLTGDLVLTFSQPLTNEAQDEFEGTLSYDVPIGNIIKTIEDIVLLDSGFAFVTMSNDNVVAINDLGLETLGLVSDEQSTIEGDEGFNRLERHLKNSIFPEVRNLELTNSESTTLDKITIKEKDYLLVTKNLLEYQSWSPEESFFQETWTISFFAPYDEIYGFYETLESNIENKMDKINLNTILITILLALVIMYSIYRFNTIMTSELVTLANVVNDAKDKNFDVKINVTSDDEVGVLALAFRDMIGEIKDSFGKLENQNDALKEEINQRKQKDRIIDYLENFDSGTDLPNKKALLNILKDVRGEKDNFVSLVVIGLDEFRKVNEAYSWTFGDKLMKRIAERLRELLPVDSLLFKLSGDEFAFIIKEKKFKNLISIIEDTSTAFLKPFYVEKHEIAISSSIGISSYPYDSEDPLDIFKFATNAMVHAKDVNRGKYEFYNAEINSTARMRMEMINELRNAIEQDEFKLYYQPIISLETQKVTGMEALLRWHNKSLGNVPPNVFIPLAEKTRQILSIGDWVLRRALEDTKILHDLGHKELNIAINVSIIQFLEDNFVDELERHIKEVGIDPTKITIEITEGLFINDLNKIMNVLNRIKKHGISISVDDFGTGYSSLSYIKNLPLSKLKIDRSFIGEIEEEMSLKLVSGIIGLAQNLNLLVIAEGIETEEQLAIIKSKGCQEAQGYLFSKPVALDKFTLYLKK